MKFINFLIVLILISSMTLAIDSAICKSANPEEDYKSCIKQQEPLKIIWEQKSAERDQLSKDFFATDSAYNICIYNTCVKGSTNPITTTKIKTDNDEKYCIELVCEPALKSYNKKIKLLDLEEEKLKNDFNLAQCDNCIIPFCKYQLHNDCGALGKFCKSISSMYNTDYVGCSVVDNTVKNPKVNTNKPLTNSQTTINNKQTKTKLQIENENKLNKISKKNDVEIIEVETKKGKKKIILINPDNSKASFGDKVKYYTNNEIKTKISDKIGDIPVIGPYKDYIVKFFEDQKSDNQKATDTQVQLNVKKNAAKLFNQMDGTGNKELSLSPGKNLIPSTPVTKPFEYIINELGIGIKKEMAKGFEKEYNTALAVARAERESGTTWTKTIEQTILFVGEEHNEGKKWTQTLNAYSKPDYKTQSGRVKAYIMQMKINGELK
jgi:hypothetical protein